MIYTRNATLDQRPKAFNGVGMNTTTNILFVVVADSKVCVANPSHSVVARELIGKEGGVSIYALDCERDDGVLSHIGDDFSNDLAIPLSSTDNFSLAFRTPTTLAVPGTADIGFINLYLTCKMMEVIIKKSAYLLKHTPCRLVGNTSFPFNLLGVLLKTG